MPPNLESIITVIACFLFGVAIGYLFRLQSLMDEVAEWKEIARKAQRLNQLSDELSQERAQHVHEYED